MLTCSSPAISNVTRSGRRDGNSKSPEHAQQFLAPLGPISDHFRPHRFVPTSQYHRTLQTRFATWHEVTVLAAA
ncbi:MAG: hypothetical protein M3442_02505 [Chloroflexota bacterium]|nr:hypothetical protein [Chloroflexota bacterium]